MLPHVVEFRSQFSTGNCSQLFTSTVQHNRQNYCLHLSLLCFGSQLLSKRNHISQISLELEKYNFKINTPVYQTPNIQVLYHRRISTVFLVWHEGWSVRCTGLGAERPWWGALGYSSLLYRLLPLNQQECSIACVKHWRKSQCLLWQIISALLLLKELISVVLWKFYWKPNYVLLLGV